MINEKYFKETNEILVEILDNSNLITKEIEDKKNKLNVRLKAMLTNKKIDNHYCSLAHEIKSYDFLKKYGSPTMAKDTKSEKGPDFKLNNYNIECVCCSSGDVSKNGLENYRLNENQKSLVYNYNELLEILLPRMTQELNVKSDKFKKYINEGVIKSNEPCIIFISLGDIASDFFSGKYGFNFLDILIGKSHLTLQLDKKGNKVVGSFYNHVEEIMKHNGSRIDANFFVNSQNEHISAIIFTDAYIIDKYDNKNTYLFLNPYATNKIKLSDFKNIVYWKANSKLEYIPRYNGKNLWQNIKNK